MTFTQREAQGETLWLSSPVSGIDVIQLWMRGQEAARIVSGRAARTRPCLQRRQQRGIVRFLDGHRGGRASFDGFDGFDFLRTDLSCP